MRLPTRLVLIVSLVAACFGRVDAAPGDAAADDLHELPLVEVPATARPASPARSGDLVVLMTGDGGWAGLDKALSQAFAAQGIPTVALNSLRYFWTERTPQQVARDLARVINHYSREWNKSRIVLVGYSFGADVMPFAVNRLPANVRERVATVNLLALSSTALFEVHVSNWITGGPPGVPVAPELRTLQGVPVLCMYGGGEDDTLCPELPSQLATTRKVGSGHHFGGRYEDLAGYVLEFSDPATVAGPD